MWNIWTQRMWAYYHIQLFRENNINFDMSICKSSFNIDIVIEYIKYKQVIAGIIVTLITSHICVWIVKVNTKQLPSDEINTQVF